MSQQRRVAKLQADDHADRLQQIQQGLAVFSQNLKIAQQQLGSDLQQLDALHLRLLGQQHALLADSSALQQRVMQLPGKRDIAAPSAALVEAELSQWLERQLVESQERSNLPELLDQHPILRDVVRQQLLRRIAATVEIDSQHEQGICQQIWDGLPGQPPRHLHNDWLSQLPTALQPVLQQRWQAVRIEHWCETTYGQAVEQYFADRSKDLEQVVYSMIRLEEEGMALEIYLRLLDEADNFNELARHYSTGDERITLGLVGPIVLEKLHPLIRVALASLAVGDICEPFQVEDWHILLRLESRWPARLDAQQRRRLLQEMLDNDIDAALRGLAPPHGASLQAPTSFPIQLQQRRP